MHGASITSGFHSGSAMPPKPETHKAASGQSVVQSILTAVSSGQQGMSCAIAAMLCAAVMVPAIV
jgi:hypothetical protein